MQKRFSYNVTVLIFILSILIYFGITFGLSTIFNWPEWTYTIWFYFFFLLVYEIPSRFGPQAFETPLSRYFKLSFNDKAILGFSFVILILGTILIGLNKNRFTQVTTLLSLVFMFAIVIGPIWIFGSTEAKNLIFKKNNYALTSKTENAEQTNHSATEQPKQ